MSGRERERERVGQRDVSIRERWRHIQWEMGREMGNGVRKIWIDQRDIKRGGGVRVRETVREREREG